MILFTILFAFIPEMGVKILLDSTYIDVQQGLKERSIIVKILGTRGREEFGDIKVRYNKDISRFNVLNAYTELSDGRKVKPEKKAISNVSAPEVYTAPMYSMNMMKVVSFPQVEEGSVVHYQYRISSKKREKKQVSGALLFGGNEKIKKKVLVISLPSTLSIISNIKPIIVNQEKRKLYVFKKSNIPRIPKEMFSPPMEELADYLVYSTDTLWKDVGKKFWNKFNKGIKSFKKLNNIDECISFVRDSIRNIPLSLGFAGYKPNSPKNIWKNRYGESRDKSALLISLLRGIGVSAYPVLISSKGLPIVKEVPTLSQFDRVIVGIQEKSGFRFVDPTSEYSRGEYFPEWIKEGLMIRQDTAYFIKIENSKMIPSKVVVNNDLHVDEKGGLNAFVSETLYGAYSNSIRKLIFNKTPKELERYIKSRINNIMTGAVLDTFFYSNCNEEPLVMNISFHIKNFGEIQGNQMHINIIEDILNIQGFRGMISIEHRKTPLYIKLPYDYQEKIVIHFPSRAKVAYSPAPRMEKLPFCRVNISSLEEDGSLTIKKSIFILNGKYDEEGYKNIRKKILPAANRREREVYLRME